MTLPSYKASMFRGGFGKVLKDLHCINISSKKDKYCPVNCPVKNTCLYYYIFEEKDKGDHPRPYVIEVPFFDKRGYKKNEIITFDLILIGKATEYINHCIFAFKELGNRGLTKQQCPPKQQSQYERDLPKQRCKYELTQVTDDKNNIVFKNNAFISKGSILTADKVINEKIQKIQGNKLTLNFTTPLSIVVGKKLRKEPSFEFIIKTLTRRITAMYKYYQPIPTEIDYKSLIEKSKKIEHEICSTKFKEWKRMSNRKGIVEKFKGYTGTITYTGNFDDFKPYLILGEYIHIGGKCVFGHGKYNIL